MVGKLQLPSHHPTSCSDRFSALDKAIITPSRAGAVSAPTPGPNSPAFPRAAQRHLGLQCRSTGALAPCVGFIPGKDASWMQCATQPLCGDRAGLQVKLWLAGQQTTFYSFSLLFCFNPFPFLFCFHRTAPVTSQGTSLQPVPRQTLLHGGMAVNLSTTPPPSASLVEKPDVWASLRDASEVLQTMFSQIQSNLHT